MDERDDLRGRFEALGQRPWAGDLRASWCRNVAGEHWWLGGGDRLTRTAFAEVATLAAEYLPPSDDPPINRWLGFVRECFPSYFEPNHVGREYDDTLVCGVMRMVRQARLVGRIETGALPDVVALSGLACDRLPEKAAVPPYADDDAGGEPRQNARCPRGQAPEWILDYLCAHHQYEGQSIGNWEPVTVAQVMAGLKGGVKKTSVHNWFRKHFDGGIDAYRAACQRETLLPMLQRLRQDFGAMFDPEEVILQRIDPRAADPAHD